ncbi:hypothetical protein UF75_0379 [Desulfosporosinus sp. I2]|nr:hypothetical protein UF75_0379 [Desulfosporosinus sp. I2]
MQRIHSLGTNQYARLLTGHSSPKGECPADSGESKWII